MSRDGSLFEIERQIARLSRSNGAHGPFSFLPGQVSYSVACSGHEEVVSNGIAMRKKRTGEKFAGREELAIGFSLHESRRNRPGCSFSPCNPTSSLACYGHFHRALVRGRENIF